MSDRHDSGCRMLLALPEGTTGAARYLGERQEHRLTLERRWAAGEGFAIWIGMNPSGATEHHDDLTVRKECVWTRTAWDLPRMVKVNIGTLRWTDSRTLAQAGLPAMHPSNLPAIRSLAAEADKIVLTSGKPPEPLLWPARELFRILKQDGRKPLCLGVTKEGWPKHSSRLGYATPFVEFAL